MMDGSNDQGWGFLVLCAVGLFTAHFLKTPATSQGGLPTPAKTPFAPGSMGQDERVVETDSASTDLTVDAADARGYKSADMAMDKSYSGPVTVVGGAAVDVSHAAPAAATNTSRGEGPMTRSRANGTAVGNVTDH